MSNNHKITNVNHHNGANLAIAALTGGLSLFFPDNIKTYTIEDKDGNEKKVTARHRGELGDKISKGKFDK